MGKTKEFNFTKKNIEVLVPGEERYTQADAQTRGLGVMVQPTGHKAFFWYRKVRGRPTWRTLGDFPDLSVENARAAAGKLSGELAKWKASGYEGPSPFERKRDLATTRTLGDLAERYIESQIKMRSTNPGRAERETRQAVDLYLAKWKGRRLGDITREEVKAWHEDLGKRSGLVTANRAWQLLRTMFNWAIGRGAWRGENPARVLKGDLFPERSRERYVREGEAHGFFRALRDEPSRDLRDFVWLALFTGARKGDVLAMRWDQLGRGAWTVPNLKRPEWSYTVALMPEAAAVLKSRQGNGSEWVFPSSGMTGHVVGLKRPWKKFLKRAGLADFRIHDLRRTLGSWQANQGVSLSIIGKSLGHRDPRSTAIYARLQAESAKPAVEQATRGMLAASKKKPKPLKG